jgi:hypothetical protein
MVRRAAARRASSGVLIAGLKDAVGARGLVADGAVVFMVTWKGTVEFCVRVIVAGETVACPRPLSPSIRSFTQAITAL